MIADSKSIGIAIPARSGRANRADFRSLSLRSDFVADRQNALGPGDNRNVDHLTLEGDGTITSGHRGVISGDHALGARDLGSGWREGLVQDRDLLGVDTGATIEAKPTRLQNV